MPLRPEPIVCVPQTLLLILISEHPAQNKNRPFGRFVFWWEWLDSNQLSHKTTDLQSAPALQLRRTPNLSCHIRGTPSIVPQERRMVRAEGIEPSFQAWKACILAFVLCPQQIVSLMIIYNFLSNASIFLTQPKTYLCA